MKLSKFVEQALVEVCKGITEAKSNEVNNNGALCPHVITDADGNRRVLSEPREIVFSVLVKTENNDELEVIGDVKGSIGFTKIAKASGEASLEKRKVNSDVVSHTISFSVPFVPEALRTKNFKT